MFAIAAVAFTSFTVPAFAFASTANAANAAAAAAEPAAFQRLLRAVPDHRERIDYMQHLHSPKRCTPVGNMFSGECIMRRRYANIAQRPEWERCAFQR